MQKNSLKFKPQDWNFDRSTSVCKSLRVLQGVLSDGVLRDARDVVVGGWARLEDASSNTSRLSPFILIPVLEKFSPNLGQLLKTGSKKGENCTKVFSFYFLASASEINFNLKFWKNFRQDLEEKKTWKKWKNINDKNSFHTYRVLRSLGAAACSCLLWSWASRSNLKRFHQKMLCKKPTHFLKICSHFWIPFNFFSKKSKILKKNFNLFFFQVVFPKN